MNIFYLDKNPKTAAQYHCDKHVVKMILECAQMLSTVHREFGNIDDRLYRKTHSNHPSTKWVKSSSEHYKWLYRLFVCLCDEYKYRYKKTHKTDEKLRKILRKVPKKLINNGFSQPPQAMPVEYHSDDSVSSYRLYYNKDKAHFCKWTNRPIPFWFDGVS